jgi:DNA (cytosine-5)-methyltransferase 1
MSQVAVSLFSGCMGFDLGLEAAGVRTAVAVENDPVCQDTIKANRPDVAIFGDARTVTGQQLRAAAGGHVDILAGGPPCQSFSTIGASRSLNDDRGDLVGQFLRLLGEVNPRLFVFENVPGITSLGMQPDGRRPWPWLLGQFRGLGYAVNWWQLNAVNYGSPQRRARVIAMGAADGAAPPRPHPHSRRHDPAGCDRGDGAGTRRMRALHAENGEDDDTRPTRRELAFAATWRTGGSDRRR